MKRLGLVAGEGGMPRAVADEAKRQGYTVVAIAIKGLTDETIEQYTDSVTWIKPGKVGSGISHLKENGTDEVVFAGKFPKSMILRGALNPDMRLIRFLFNLKDKGDDTILNSVSKELAKDGIKLRDIRDFTKGLLTPEGVLTCNEPTEDEWKDVEYGFRIAKGVGELEIGQTVVVKEQAVVAVEAVEGTDETILRGGKLSGGGAVVVKVSRPGQDMRLDVPAVGLRTLRRMKEVRIRVLALEAGRSIFLEKEDFIRQADEAGIAVVGITAEFFKENS